MPVYKITWAQYFRGARGTDDGGYYAVHADASGREFDFICSAHDGYEPRCIKARWRGYADSPNSLCDRPFRRYSAANAAKRAPKLRTAFIEFLAAQGGAAIARTQTGAGGEKSS